MTTLLVSESEDSESSEKDERSDREIQKHIDTLADSFLKGSPLFIASARYIDLPKRPFKKTRRSTLIHSQNQLDKSNKLSEVSAWLRKTKNPLSLSNGTPPLAPASESKKRRRKDVEPVSNTDETSKKIRVLTVSEKSNVPIKKSTPVKAASKGVTKPKNRSTDQQKDNSLPTPPKSLLQTEDSNIHPEIPKENSSTSTASVPLYPSPSPNLKGKANVSASHETAHAEEIHAEEIDGDLLYHADSNSNLVEASVTRVEEEPKVAMVVVMSPQHSATPPPPTTTDHANDKLTSSPRRKSLDAIDPLIPGSSPMRSSPARISWGVSNSVASNCSPGSSFQSFDLEENLHEIEAFLEKDLDWRNDLPKEVFSDSDRER